MWCPYQCPPVEPWDCPERQAVGKTCGGFNTIITVAVNDDHQLLGWHLLAGNVAKWKGTPKLLEGMRPSVVVAPNDHDNNRFRQILWLRLIQAAIPNHSRRKRRYPEHSAIKLQRVADSVIARLKRFRRVGTRYEKTSEGYDAVVALAALWIALLRDHPEQTGG
ncbi:MAG: transposase [Chloroflexi bacterium]|nr:transposase [Chloroflexota bacterium]MYD47038.1 transposase [Chloroflexota bacterium]